MCLEVPNCMFSLLTKAVHLHAECMAIVQPRIDGSPISTSHCELPVKMIGPDGAG